MLWTMNKVQKIREEVERLFNHVKDSNFESDSGAFYYLKDLLDYIDSLQEEPKECMYSKGNYTDEDRKALCDGCEEECKYNKKEPVSKDKLTFTSLPRLLDRIKPTDRAKWYSSRLADALEKEGYITDAKIVRESIKLMNGEKVPMATMDEEPVGEDLPHIHHRDTLDEFAYQCAYDLSNDWAKETPEWKDVKTACKLGAQWQKEQMLEKAIDARCFEFQSDALFSFRLPANNYLVGSKVKVIVIEED